jgi:hypothetical protein
MRKKTKSTRVNLTNLSPATWDRDKKIDFQKKDLQKKNQSSIKKTLSKKIVR